MTTTNKTSSKVTLTVNTGSKTHVATWYGPQAEKLAAYWEQYWTKAGYTVTR